MTHAKYNPYYNITSIDNPELFFNRSMDIESLLNSLFSGTPQCISIVGQRKIGKTSLVHHLTRPNTVNSFRFPTSNYLFLHFNCQKHPYALKSSNDFYKALLNHLSTKVPNSLRCIIPSPTLISNNEYIGQVWERVLKDFGKENFFIIVVFDEFGKAIAQEPLIRGGLFGSLRGYAQDNPNFAWITCTRRSLQELFEESFEEYNISRIQRRSESDFYNIAPVHPIGLFEETETLELVCSPASFQGVTFSPEDVRSIISFGGNFPYFVQRACYHFFNAYMQEAVQHKTILQRCIKESTSLWKDYWDKLDAKQQQILLEAASEHPVENSSYELESLKEAALIYEDSGGILRPFSKEFGHFIQGLDHHYHINNERKPLSKQIIPSQSEAEIFLDDIKTTIEQSDIEQGFKTTALYDLQQAKTSYESRAYKACVIMLGAVLEGLMLGTLCRTEVMETMRSSVSIPKSIEKRMGGIHNPAFSDRVDFAKIIADKLSFNDYKDLISQLIPNIETLKVEGIQQFRNAIHPWRSVREPDVYAEYDRARAMIHINSLQILARHILSWNP